MNPKQPTEQTGRAPSRIVAELPGLRVGGRVTAASDGGRFDVIDPADGGVIASVASATVEDAADAIDAADSTAALWAATAPRTRSVVLARAFALMIERSDELARLIVAENGKVLADARSEFLYAAEFFRWYSEEAVRIPGSVRTAPSRYPPDTRHSPPGRHRRPGHAVEPSSCHGDAEDRAGGGRRLRRRWAST